MSKLAILKNETLEAHLHWVKACQKAEVPYDVIDLCSGDWLEMLVQNQYNYCLACPSGTVTYWKLMYDERIRIIDEVLCLPVYPSYLEISLHENKRFLSYWLTAHKLPHPKTFIFYSQSEANNFVENCTLPIVSKINIGASGHGVKILRTRQAVKRYIHDAFSAKGIRPRIGPNWAMGDYKARLVNILKNPDHLKKRVATYNKIAKDPQKNFVLFQQYIPHDFEWRIVKIGDSFFGHKKIKKGDKASGTKGIDYAIPSSDLLSFIKAISEKHNFGSMSFDIFEYNGEFLINEMQTIFGHVQAFICEKDGKPGRYQFLDNQWEFEAGMFNTNLSYDLRLQDVIGRINE